MLDADARKAGPPTRRPGRRALILLLSLALLAAAVLAALPHAAAWAIRAALLKAGAETVQVADVDVNPFTLRLALRGLTVTHRGEAVLWVGGAHVRLGWRPLLKRRILIEEAGLDDTRLRIVRRPDGSLAGGVPLFAPGRTADEGAATGTGWAVGLAALDVTGTELRYEAPGQGHVVRIEHLALRNLAPWAPETASGLSLDGSVDGGLVAVEASLSPFADQPSAKGTLKLTGMPLSPLLPLARPLTALSGHLSLDQQFALVSAPEGFRVAPRGTARLDALDLAVAGHHAEARDIAWEGDVGLALAAGGVPAWGVDGRLSGEGLDVDRIPGGRRLRLGNLTMEGRLDGGSGGVTGEGRARLADLALVRGPGGAPLAVLEQGSLEGVRRAGPGGVEIARATFKALTLTPPAAEGAPAAALFTLGAADLEGVRLGSAGLDLTTLRLSGPDALLVREADGRFADLEAMISALSPPAPVPSQTAEAPPPEAPAPPFVVRVGEASLAVGGRVRVRDGSVVPPYEAVLDLDRAHLKGLDTARPDSPAELGIDATLGRYTRVSVRGTVVPLADRLTMDLAGEVTQLELPPLNPYATPALGYHLDAGQLDARLRLGANAGRLDGDAELTVRGLNVSQVEGQPGGLAEELPVPLGQALDLLKDRDDTIRVKVPVSGDLADPRLGVRHIVNKAVGKALTAGALGYVQVALQPFGAVLAAAQLAGKAIALRLDPMPFDPGDTALTERDRDYAARLGKLLTDRPRIAVRLCGRAAAADRAALASPPAAAQGAAAPAAAPVTDDALLALAEARADAVKARLVEDHGIDAGRLLVCRPEIDPDPAARPRVDLLI